ncbi:LTA synthase family protein [Paenibacillus flagellatus]|uniref:Sulfatase n=1 Tax=Paenibacillus flagellatus TaxID=2211139 RepID=A0A2V5K3P6_9BACL|nr:LTA synthase family protein [Paenibacillus flagellatus]PYI53858.1 sulfatase [Paenibacillus flagellatus]
MTRIRPFLFFSAIMTIKSFLTWSVLYEETWSWTPLLTEIPFIWIFFCLIELFASKRKLAVYVLVNLLFTAVFFAVIMYYKYYGVIVTYHALKMVNQVTAVKNSVFSLMHPYYLFIFLDVVVLGAMLLRSKRAELWKRIAAPRAHRGVLTFVLAGSIALCLSNIVPNRASMSEFNQAKEMGILGYEAYTIFAKKEPEPIAAGDITQQTIDVLKGTQPPETPETPEYAGAASGRNVIIIQLESFQNFLVDLKVDGKEVTPVLNGLVRDHFYFPRFYQQVGPGNTSDAEFVVNTSYYIPPTDAATQRYAGKRLPSLPKLLAANGYRSATFHTNTVEFWNRGQLYDALGFERYYDSSFFGQEDIVFFGASDETLYAKTADELKRLRDEGKPVYAHVISMTAHHPYTIPPEKDRIAVPERYRGTFVGDYLRAQSYADYALGQFIDKLKANGLWDESLIVVYGDHLGLPIYSLTRDEKDMMNELLGHPYAYPDMLNVPLVLAAPGVTQPQTFERVGGQVDLLPTIANLLGVSLADYLHFGLDLLNESANLLPQRYYLPTGSFINEEAIFVPGNGFSDGVSYPLDATGPTSGPPTEEQYERALRLLRLSDSYVSQLPDKVTVPEP